MQSCFTQEPVEGRVQLDPDDARHLISMLRALPKEHLAVVFGGQRFEAELMIDGDAVYGQLVGPLPGTEPRCQITLYQGLPKGDKMDLIVQTCTQLGVQRIVPCLMRRCVSRWEGGITTEEMALLCARPLTLGPRILRTEVAGMAAWAMR